MRPVDLHLHSVASDGTLTPAAVVQAAAARGLAGLSLTDHDTVAGVEEARAEAGRLGLAFLIGAELSANEPGRTVHVLGYGFDPSDPGLTAFFEGYRDERVRRAQRMTEKLRELGVRLELDDVMAEAPGGLPTRAHVARALVNARHVPNVPAAFNRWLARGRPAFVEKRPTPPAEVFDLIHGAGGVAVLAHPGRDFTVQEIRRWVEDGLEGVEIRHPANGPAERKALTELADELGLLRTGGSDWHGPDGGGNEIGSQDVPMEWMESLVERCSARS